MTWRQYREDAVGDSDEVHSCHVDVESFVIELHVATVDRTAEVLQAMSNHTPAVLDCGASR